jgi:two-component system chemotaxis response regulator CheY
MKSLRNKILSAKILVVDDSHSMRKLLRAMIEAADYKNVTESDNGPDAILRIEKGECDLLVTDWKMDPMDGLELSKRVRAMSNLKLATMPIILVSAFCDKELVAKARDYGINEVMAKPVAAKVIQAKVESLLTVPTSFVRAPEYKGPDRRRHRQGYDGQEKRRPNPPAIMEVIG